MENCAVNSLPSDRVPLHLEHALSDTAGIQRAAGAVLWAGQQSVLCGTGVLLEYYHMPTLSVTEQSLLVLFLSSGVFLGSCTFPMGGSSLPYPMTASSPPWQRRWGG